MPAVLTNASPAETVREKFERASKIRYCILSPHERLPGVLPERLDVLADEPEAFVAILGLQRLRGQLFGMTVAGEIKQVAVYGHNQNVLPSIFETGLMVRAHLQNGLKIPSKEDYWKLRLYWQLVYENLLRGTSDRVILMDGLRQIVGNPIIPKASHLLAHIN